MNLAELQREADAIGKEKGWWDQERTFGDCIALVHSELSEAVEAYREYGDVLPRKETIFDLNIGGRQDPDFEKRKPFGVPSELADVVIRVAEPRRLSSCGGLSPFGAGRTYSL